MISPLPLEATPLPPSLPSPVSVAPLENGLDVCKKEEVEDNIPHKAKELEAAAMPLLPAVPLLLHVMPCPLPPVPLSLPAVPLPPPVSVAAPAEPSLPPPPPLAPPRSLPAMEALVSMMQQLPDSNVKVIPVKVVSVDTGKEAMIAVQGKPTSLMEKFVPIPAKLAPLQENIAPTKKSLVDNILPLEKVEKEGIMENSSKDLRYLV